MSSELEFVDIYDRNRELTGVKKPRHGEGSELGDNEFILIVTALLETLDGKYLITQRSMDKKWAAGWWEISGGGAMAGETGRDAVNREVFEETGLHIEDVKETSVYCYVNEDKEGHDNYFCDIYHFQFDFSMEDVKLQVEEAIDGKIVSMDEIHAIGAEGKFLHYKRIQEALRAEEILKAKKA